MIDGVANFFPNINYVVLASKTPKDVTIYEDVSREEYLNVKGYIALDKQKLKVLKDKFHIMIGY